MVEFAAMNVADFSFHLPTSLIASAPASERTGSRLLSVNAQADLIKEKQFSDLEEWLQPDDLLVLNNTRVIPARLRGQKTTGGKVEVLVERILSDQQVLAHVKSSNSPKPGSVLMLEQAVEAEVQGREGALFVLSFPPEKNALDWLEAYGHIPLPPYIDRAATEEDQTRYQTVYAKDDCPGAVAAPTAGLHFDQPMLARLRDKGISIAEVTLHVGAGTFQPVKVDQISDHQMHSEWCSVSQDVVDQVHECKRRGGRVIAVGTTSVRSLETAAVNASECEEGAYLAPFEGDTQIFIYPGVSFNVVDAIITNFHLPESTLMMLVSAFSGRKRILRAYEQAIASGFRFYSYGDAMLLSEKIEPEVAFDS